MVRRFAVTMKVTHTKKINVWATDEAAAMDKAEQICSAWNVDDAEAVEATEIEGD